MGSEKSLVGLDTRKIHLRPHRSKIGEWYVHPVNNTRNLGINVLD